MQLYSELIRVKMFPQGAFSERQTIPWLPRLHFLIVDMSRISSVLLLNIQLRCKTQCGVKAVSSLPMPFHRHYQQLNVSAAAMIYSKLPNQKTFFSFLRSVEADCSLN